jgi:hypothetical protein
VKPPDLNVLRRDGIVRCRSYLSHRQMLEAVQYLVARPTYDAHVKVYSDQTGRPVEQTLGRADVACHDMADVLNAPHLLWFALSHADFARQYLRAEPVLYSVNAFWTCAGNKDARGDIQAFHRDNDDDRFVALFVYGSDVTKPRYGAHCYLKGTHIRGDDGQFAPSAGEDMVLGGPGQAFIVDPQGLHMGRKPEEGQRLLIWFRFGISDPPRSYVWDKLSPVEIRDRSIVSDDATRRLLHLVAR